MTHRFVSLDTYDVRFPTSREFDGSDAMNADPDYSAAYVVLRTDAVGGGEAGGESTEGHGFAFTIGRGNDVQTAAIEALRPYLVGRLMKEVLDDLGGLYRELVYDSQLRWLGPEKGVMHMAISAVVNALWDLKAKRAGLPLWQLLSAMSPEELVDLVDFRYLSDALTPQEALRLLRRGERGRQERVQALLAGGYPAYATSPGWLGYDDAKLERLCREALAAGFTHIKLKVGADLDDDLRRMRIARQVCGPGVRIAIDANQRWDVGTAVEWVEALAPFDPWWVEEPTSPDDVVGHAAIARRIAPIPVATGEHVQNRVVFKQLLQLNAVSFVQLDAARVAGVNENVAILLLAAKFGVPVCPHAGGVGLCELVQHLSMFDYVAVSGSMHDRAIEYVDHLHEHFTDPVRMHRGHYLAPLAPGFSSTMRAESRARYAFPDGPVWRAGADAAGASPSR
ncbi:enolase C-terminal domain-like protein [Dactylosporangium aurantiacum]|uniref:enolase C-terminal domain-like protein n=1 Tax=Dactylosporangium aurantiacum TaxID=35754 RepID=UPI000525FABE|nr:enolase C-terminal domain-like protein [Dactylosporangium aurantiacum]MDG6109662.1 enolase C-terminal domain-like protein [Dactylosporangium aurantiacum]